MIELNLSVPLDPFDLEVECVSKHHVVGVFGPSGSGKTTLLEAIAGIRRKASGRLKVGGAVWLDSARSVNLRPEQRGVGYVPQDDLLFPHIQVEGNLRYGSRRGADADLFQLVVDVLELSTLLQRRVADLSGGERQRVAIGRALCSGPRLLVMDEPMSSLDAALRKRVLPFLVRVREEFKVPMWIVSHDPFELQALCDQVYALSAGRVVASGPPGQVFARPDVYQAAAAEQGFVNTLSGVIDGHNTHSSRVRIGDPVGGFELSVRRVDCARGASVIVGLPAKDILVATSAVEGLSARNCVCAQVDALEQLDHQFILVASLGSGNGPRLVAELTPDAAEDLMLKPGKRVWLFFKSSCIEVYA